MERNVASTPLYEVCDLVCGQLRNLATDPDTDGTTYDVLMDAAYLVESALAALGYLRNARIDLETGANKATAIRTIDGGIRKVEEAFEQARVSA